MCKQVKVNNSTYCAQVAGQWAGEVFYTFADGPRAGKKDIEIWDGGEIKSSKKYFGKGEEFLVENWEDLKNLETLTRPEC